MVLKYFMNYRYVYCRIHPWQKNVMLKSVKVSIIIYVYIYVYLDSHKNPTYNIDFFLNNCLGKDSKDSIEIRTLIFIL